MNTEKPRRERLALDETLVIEITGATITITNAALDADPPPTITIESKDNTTFEESSNMGIGIRSADPGDVAEAEIKIVPWEYEE